MRPATIEERVRHYVEAEQARIPVPQAMASRILHAVEVSRPSPRRARLAVMRVATAVAAVLLLGTGIAWMRTAQMTASTVNGSWSSAASMAVPRAYHTATLLPNGKVLVVGGRGMLALSAPWQRGGGAIASAELYDPKTHRWSSAGALNSPRFAHTATLLANGKVLVVGGSPTLPNASLPSGVDFLSSAELYDPQTNSWSLAASMRAARSYHTATLLADGRVLVSGGIAASSAVSGSALASAELYDPAANTWTVAAPMRSERWDHSATLLADHRVLVVGGMDRSMDFPTGTAPSTGVRTAELFDPATDAWSPAPSMRYTRISPTSTLLPNGSVMVVGDNGVNEQTAEIFDPAIDGWSVSPNPAAGRAGHIAVLLPGGSVLVAGGLADSSAELFDWRRDSWASGGSLAVIRSGATATVLPSGEVLVAGGFGSGSNAWASAELYDPQGRNGVGSTPARSAVPVGAVIPLVAAAAIVLAVGFWLLERRRARAGVVWLD